MNNNEGFLTQKLSMADCDGKPIFPGSLPSQYVYNKDILAVYNVNHLDAFIKNRLSDRAIHIIAFAQMLPQGAFIAGSSCMSVIDPSVINNDIDIFFTTRLAVDNTINLFVTNSYSPTSMIGDAEFYYEDTKMWLPISTIANYNIDKLAILNIRSRDVKYQLVMLHGFVNPQHCINAFDFTCCKVAIDRNFIYSWPTAVSDIMSRRLDLVLTEVSPKTLLQRVTKYMKKGFTPVASLYDIFNETILNSLTVEDTKIVPKLSIWNKYDTGAVEIIDDQA